MSTKEQSGSHLGTPRPISFTFPDEDLDRLQRKLDETRLPAQPIVPNLREPWSHGSELGKLRQLVDDWRRGNPRDSNDVAVGADQQGVKAWWRGVEAALNEHPHYLVEIEGLTIHYQVFTAPAAAEDEDSAKPLVPVLFSHGWPGSFIEARPFAQHLLAGHRAASPYRFSVVAPSLPGYGLSSGPLREGWTLADTARVFSTLMTGVLGHSAYLAQGGDWGSLVTRLLSNYPACALYHTNMIAPRPPLHQLPVLAARSMGFLSDATLDSVLSMVPGLRMDALDRLMLRRGLNFRESGFAYTLLNATKPATIGYALVDNPVGILSYLLEKFHAWSDPRCPAFAASDSGAAEVNRESLVNDQEILTNVMVYYLTGSVHTSFLPYRESMAMMADTTDKFYNREARAKPFGTSAFAYEIAGGPRSWLSRYPVNLVFYRRHDRGGHFASLDNPAALAGDVADFANEFWADAAKVAVKS